MLIYHMCRHEEWQGAVAAGGYQGSSQDQKDGFIHFSTAEQIATSAAKHRAGQNGILLIEVDSAALGDALKWEQSRGGEMFPHLYGPLQSSAVAAVRDLPLGPDGTHILPSLPLRERTP